MINPPKASGPPPGSISLGMIGMSLPSLLRSDPHFVFPSPTELACPLQLGTGFEPTCQDIWRDAEGFLWHQGDCLRQELADFISTCDSCQRAKALRKAPSGLLQSLSVPSQPWSSIGMDFIVKLPKSCGFDAILASWFSAKDRNDRGSLFVSTFWKLIYAKLGIKPTPSTTYHPQTDGQTEHMNQTLEEYLRHFCGYRQDDWADLLPMAELCLNNSTAASTGFSPFFLWQGYHPRVNAFLTTSLVPAVDAYITLLEQTQSEAAASLSRARELQARYYGRGRRPGDVFQPSDRVLLSRRCISSLRPSSNHVYPKLHPVFNISLVSRYRDPSLNSHPQSRKWFSSLQHWWIGEGWQLSWISVGSKASASICCNGRMWPGPRFLGPLVFHLNNIGCFSLQLSCAAPLVLTKSFPHTQLGKILRIAVNLNKITRIGQRDHRSTSPKLGYWHKNEIK
ncbi:hypothetical protein O181_000473 [Austropuccinia psidii MF-1]|uniref:Integrase catalytic domain-containing protein n=1 Tax=Austropuccinia psidii MF-1 TaxID=1389203 RepID=A0A9Q3B8L1_9BASI|nr:hypothetical protein [Austropuccinia psidii MF-1]